MDTKTKESLREDLKTRFWSRWEKSRELDKPKIVEELSGVKSPYMSGTLFNSYCEDLYEYLQRKYKFDPMEKM